MLTPSSSLTARLGWDSSETGSDFAEGWGEVVEVDEAVEAAAVDDDDGSGDDVGLGDGAFLTRFLDFLLLLLSPLDLIFNFFNKGFCSRVNDGNLECEQNLIKILILSFMRKLNYVSNNPIRFHLVFKHKT